MTGFRGSDEALEREILALEKIARLRVRRTAAELREIERDLRVLRRERARRNAPVAENVTTEATVDGTAP
jgi:hypothetical protein